MRSSATAPIWAACRLLEFGPRLRASIPARICLNRKTARFRSVVTRTDKGLYPCVVGSESGAHSLLTGVRNPGVCSLQGLILQEFHKGFCNNSGGGRHDVVRPARRYALSVAGVPDRRRRIRRRGWPALHRGDRRMRGATEPRRCNGCGRNTEGVATGECPWCGTRLLYADGGAESVERDHRTLEDIAGSEVIHVECTTRKAEPGLCDGWGEDVELDEPAYMEEGRIYLPGFSWECPECGNFHAFVIDGVEVSNLV